MGTMALPSLHLASHAPTPFPGFLCPRSLLLSLDSYPLSTPPFPGLLSPGPHSFPWTPVPCPAFPLISLLGLVFGVSSSLTPDSYHGRFKRALWF